MIKSDSASLDNLSQTIRSKLEQFRSLLHDVDDIKKTLNNNWDEAKCGSFSDAMDTIGKSRADVEDGCKEMLNLINEMIELTKNYDSIRF